MKKILAFFSAVVMALAIATPAFAASISSHEQKVLDEFQAELNVWSTRAQLDQDHIAQYKAEAERALTALELTEAECNDYSAAIKDVHNLLDSANPTSKADLYKHVDEITGKINKIGHHGLKVSVDPTTKKATVTWSEGGKTVTGGTTGNSVKQTGFGLGQTVAVATASVAVIAGAFVVARKKQLFVA